MSVTAVNCYLHITHIYITFTYQKQKINWSLKNMNKSITYNITNVSNRMVVVWHVCVVCVTRMKVCIVSMCSIGMVTGRGRQSMVVPWQRPVCKAERVSETHRYRVLSMNRLNRTMLPACQWLSYAVNKVSAVTMIMLCTHMYMLFVYIIQPDNNSGWVWRASLRRCARQFQSTLLKWCWGSEGAHKICRNFVQFLTWGRNFKIL